MFVQAHLTDKTMQNINPEESTLQPATTAEVEMRPAFKKVRVLSVQFSDKIMPWEVPAFRGAIIKKAGKGSILFHNHEADGDLRYGYPMIQYKIHHHQPMILCIDQGVDEIHHFFTKKDWSVEISDRVLEMKVERMNMDQITLQVWSHHYHYHIRDWVALNQENYLIFKGLTSDEQRRQFLEQKLIGNMLSFAKGLDWHVSKSIEVSIIGDIQSKYVKVKGVNVLAFSCKFNANVYFPQFAGLGKNITFGFGVVTKINARKPLS